MEIVSEREMDRGGREREKEIRREWERARERWKERTVDILSERERKLAYVLTHAHTPPHTYARQHAHTDAYTHALIMIPDTHTHTHTCVGMHS